MDPIRRGVHGPGSVFSGHPGPRARRHEFHEFAVILKSQKCDKSQMCDFQIAI